MSYHFEELDAETRRFMLAEALEDIAQGRLIITRRLTDAGRAQYPELLRRALESGTEETFTQSLTDPAYFVDREPYLRGGTQLYRRVNYEVAARMVGETEFNIYYMRGLCRKLMTEGVTRVMVYRAKPVERERKGKRVNPGDIWFTCEALDDLRLRGEQGSFRGFLRGPYSGISLMRVPPEIPLEWQVIASDVVPPPQGKR